MAQHWWLKVKFLERVVSNVDIDNERHATSVARRMFSEKV